MTNINFEPDHQDGMGNGGFTDAVYRPGQDQTCQPMTGGLMGGVLGAFMGAAVSDNDRCAPTPTMPAVDEPELLWV